METQLTIKNFRVFDENGVTVDLKPITVLTGCNSSGKSSVVKAALMLNDVWKQLENLGPRYDISGIKLDFTTYPNNLLGGFDKVVHNSNNGKITFEYTVYSPCISKDVIVVFDFVAARSGKLNNAYLENIMLKVGDDVICALENFDEGSNFVCNYNAIFKNQIFNSVDFEEFVGGEKTLQKEDLEKIIERFRIDNSLFFIPILEVLDKKGKSGIESFVNSLNLLDFLTSKIMRLSTLGFYNRKTEARVTAMAEKINKCAEKIVNEFILGSTNLFSEYFKQLESEYLINILMVDSEERDDLVLWDYWNPFAKVYFIVMCLNQIMYPEDSIYYMEVEDVADIEFGRTTLGFRKGANYCFLHTLVEMFRGFVKKFLSECMLPPFYHPMAYVSSSRAKIKRLYQLDEKDDFTLLLKKYMESDYAGSFINKWIKQFGLGESVSFEVDEDGVGVKVYIHKTPDDEKGRLLADEGYGVTQLLSIMLQIEMSSDRRTTIFVEEPEIHLHPKYQSLLADMFVDAYKDRKIDFIIETHSEYLIRRLQLLVAGIDADENQKISKEEVSISYIYSELLSLC